MSVWVKDPADTRWFTFDWSQFLAASETIVSHTIIVDPSITKVSDTSTTTSAAAQVSGGTAGTAALITCNVRTSGGNTYQTQKHVTIRTRVS